MNSVVRRVAPPVLLALVATGLAAAPAGAAPTWVAPAVTLAQGTSHAHRGLARRRRRGRQRHGGLGGARRRRGRRPRPGLDAPGRRLVVGAGRHLGLRRHRRLDRHRHQRERLPVAVWTRGTDSTCSRPPPGSRWRSMVGTRPGQRQHRRRREAAGGRRRCRQRGRHVERRPRTLRTPPSPWVVLGRARTTCRTPPRASHHPSTTSSSRPVGRRPSPGSIPPPADRPPRHPVRRPCPGRHLR